MTVRSHSMRCYPGVRRYLIATVAWGVVALGMAQPTWAQSLEQALAQAYANNPSLAAQRARLRAVDESVPQALSGYRPTARATASIGRSYSETQIERSGTSNSALTPKTAGLSVTQPIYDATVSPAVRRAENLVQAQRATLMSAEQEVLLNAATAYLDVVQNQAVLTLNINNERVLKRQLEAAGDRFRVGEYTRTDVSQSESRLSGAVASRISAEGQLATSRATYERVIGAAPGPLKAPKPTFKLPATLDETVVMAKANNPTVLSAAFNEAAQQATVDQQFGRLLPSVSLNAQTSRTWDGSRSSGLLVERQDAAQVTAQVTIPLYQAGLPEAQVREAKQTANQYRMQIDDARQRAVEGAVSAWQSLATTRASIKSYRDQIKAAQIALDGVRQEAQVGSRTVLDVLNQEQELLNARVNLVRAERNEMVAAFTLLSAIGQLSAEQLALPVKYYDAQKNYTATRDKWIGLGTGE